MFPASFAPGCDLMKPAPSAECEARGDAPRRRGGRERDEIDTEGARIRSRLPNFEVETWLSPRTE